MALSTDRRMTLEEYLDYDDGTDARYELIDGVLFAMGVESDANVLIANFLFAIFLQFVPYYRLRNKTEIVVPRGLASSRYPDLMVLTEAGGVALPRHRRSLITLDMPAPALVVEVVSPGAPGTDNYDRDYLHKRQEYAARGIPEYWIVEHPSAALVTVCILVNGQYQSTSFCGTEVIVSLSLPNLQLTAVQILAAGR